MIKRGNKGKIKAVFNGINKVADFNEKILNNIPVGIVLLNKKGPVGIVLLNKKGKVLKTNPYVKKITGENKIGNDILKSNFSRKNNLKNTLVELLKGISFVKDGCVYMKQCKQEISGEQFFNLRGMPLKNKNIIEGALIIVEDETSAVKAKRDLEELNQKLEQRVVERTAQLNEAIKFKNRFFADASHELRTPLTIIKGNLDIINKSANFDKNISEMVSLVNGQVDYMAKMLLDLMMLARSESDSSVLEVSKFNLCHLIRNIKNDFMPLAEKYEIDLIFDKTNMRQKEINILGDMEKIQRMVSNLILNAIRYGNNKGWAKIFLEERDNYAIITIADNGIGISKKDLPYIFERFYKIDRTRHRREEDEEGTGLGLAICKWIAEAHKGKITAESKLNKGSTFKVYLPLANMS